MNCTKCGAKIEPGQGFCGECGAPVPAAAPAAPSPAPEPVPEMNALLEHESAFAGGSDERENILFETTPYGTMEAEHEGRIITEAELRRPLSVGTFLAMFFLMLIPVFNVVLILWWAFSRYTNKNKRHFAAAVIILWVLAVGLVVAAYCFVPEVQLVVDSLIESVCLFL